MSSVVCTTLFERDYHFGVAALINSLYHSGYRGRIVSGYRGELPHWALSAKPYKYGAWHDASILKTVPGIDVIFLPLTTDSHLANYKPSFMLDIIKTEPPDIDAIYYFDPDICIVRNWIFFQEWVSCGIAVCEDINSPYSEEHPLRIGWRRYYKSHGYNLDFRFPEYANSGLIGVTRKQQSIITIWRDLQNAMFDEIGGEGTTKLVNGAPFRSKGFADCFEAPDQDALNAAFEVTSEPISLLGREAMGFKQGRNCALHAVGNGKPWQRLFLWELLLGIPPRHVDKAFWQYAEGPLRPYKACKIFSKRLAIKIASLIGRFYRRTD